MKPVILPGAALVLILLLGVTARLWQLEERPMHADEAVQGMKFIELLEGEGYRYDPRHFHGPTLYYGALPIASIRGEESGPALSEVTLRLVPALSGILLVFAPLLWWRRLQWPGVLIACSLLACSPGLVYYSRMYIQESLFVASVLVALLLAFRAGEKRSWRTAVGAGLCFGLVMASKETWLLVAVAGVISVTIAWLLTAGDPLKLRPAWNLIWPATAAALTTAAIFHTSFGRNPQGLLDSVRTFFIYEPVAGHTKGPGYYFSILMGQEQGIVMGELLIPATFVLAMFFLLWGQWKWRRKVGFAPLFFGLFTVVYGAMLHAFAYKTPWLILLPLATGALFVGLMGSQMALRWRMTAVGLAAIAMVLVGGLGVWETSFRKETSTMNPFAYTPTSFDTLELVSLLRWELREEDDPVVYVISENYWPIPWYLRDRRQVGYWQELPDPWGEPDAVVADAGLFNAVQQRFGMPASFHFFEVRPNAYLVLWIRE